MTRLLREPLVHFLVLGVVIFELYSLVDRSPTEGNAEIIEVTPGRVAQLNVLFTRTWQRPPTPDELNGLIETFVKEEIFYREGRKMGLDLDDTVIRRRLQQKMEFLTEPSEAELTAGDDELRSFMAENAAKFRIPSRIAFQQVFLDAAKRGEAARQDARTLLASLRATEGQSDPAEAGDPTLLPYALPLTPVDQVERGFGSQFAEALEKVEVGRWTGPIASTFGLHLVYVEKSEPARDPALDEIRDVVVREWQSAKRGVIAEQRYQTLRKNYSIRVMLPGANAASPVGATSVSD